MSPGALDLPGGQPAAYGRSPCRRTPVALALFTNCGSNSRCGPGTSISSSPTRSALLASNRHASCRSSALRTCFPQPGWSSSRFQTAPTALVSPQEPSRREFSGGLALQESVKPLVHVVGSRRGASYLQKCTPWHLHRILQSLTSSAIRSLAVVKAEELEPAGESRAPDPPVDRALRPAERRGGPRSSETARAVAVAVAASRLRCRCW